MSAPGRLWLDRQLPERQRASSWIWWGTVAAAIVIILMSALSAHEVIARYF